MTSTGPARAHLLVDELIGSPALAGDRVVAVLHAHAAALAWFRDTAGVYRAPAAVAGQLDDGAARLRTGADDRDPVAVLGQAAVDALAVYRSPPPRERLRPGRRPAGRSDRHEHARLVSP